MLTEKQSMLVDIGVQLQEAADRYEAETDTLTSLPLKEWTSRFQELTQAWERILHEQDLLLKVPDRDKESVEKFLSHATSWLESKDTELALLEKLANKNRQLQDNIAAMLQENLPPEGNNILKECQSTCEQVGDLLEKYMDSP